MSETEYIIKKAKVEDRLFLNAEYTQVEPDGDASVSTMFTMQSKKQVHPDLVSAFDKLVPHFILLTEAIDDVSFEDLAK